MSGAPVVLLVIFIAGILFDSGNESQVVLLPDPDGSVGAVEVITEGGKALLTEAGQMTKVTGVGRAPSVPVVLSEKQIQQDFAEVFAVEPPAPIKFLLYFEQGNTQLVAASEQQLAKILTAMEQRQSYAVGIYGHSDRTGSDAYNLQLSAQRAAAIRDLLVGHGVKPQFMDVASHGEGNPLVPTIDGVAEPRNRRVEVIVR